MNRPPYPRELIAQVDLAHEPDFVLGGFQVRPSLCELSIEGAKEAVEPRVMQALVVLAQHKGSVVSRDDLVRRCWGGRAISEDALNRCIAKVRKLTEIDGGASFMIETVPRVGYRLVETVVPPTGTDSTTESVPAGTAEILPLTSPGSASANPTPVRRGQLIGMLAIAIAAIAGIAYAGWQLLPSGNDSISAQAPMPLPARVPTSSLGMTFRDCLDACPEMVVIVPVASFVMGDDETKPDRLPNESPPHEVMIRYPFALGKYAVTREEYARFVADTHRPEERNCFTLAPSGLFVQLHRASWREPGFPQTQRHPAVCISWFDAQAYVEWLSRRTGKRYRLPTEAEWEFAAGGFTHRRSDWSRQPCKWLNGGDGDYHAKFPGDPLVSKDCRDGYVHTAPVGSFPANAVGLYDVLGNAWQWTADCYHPNYQGAPTDGSAWTSGDCSLRVARGQAWTDDPRRVHLSRRGMGTPRVRFSSNGFRVARSM